jgi:hypothetical protein
MVLYSTCIGRLREKLAAVVTVQYMGAGSYFCTILAGERVGGVSVRTEWSPL